MNNLLTSSLNVFRDYLEAVTYPENTLFVGLLDDGLIPDPEETL